MKVIEDRISSSIVPHALKKAEKGESYEYGIGHPPSGSLLWRKRQVDHEAAQLLDEDTGGQ